MLAACWPAFEPYIALGCARSLGCYNVAYIAEMLSRRGYQLWSANEADGTMRGVIVTHLNVYPTGLKAAQVIIFAGDGMGAQEQTQLIDVLRAWARAQDCHRLEYAGRIGFLRACKGADGAEWRQTTINAVMDV